MYRTFMISIIMLCVFGGALFSQAVKVDESLPKYKKVLNYSFFKGVLISARPRLEY